METMQYYDSGKFLDAIIAKGMRISAAHRAINESRAAKQPPEPPLSFDSVRRLCRGEFNNPTVAKAVAEWLGKDERDFRLEARPKAAGAKRSAKPKATKRARKSAPRRRA